MGGGRGAIFALVFSMFVPVLAFALLVLIRGVFVLFVFAPMLVFLLLVFPATATVMFTDLFCLLPIGLCLFLFFLLFL